MNIYKKTIISSLVLAVGTICISDLLSPAHSNAGGAPIGKTGSPGDGSNCTGCHSGVATTSAGLITSNVPVTGYIPGNTYTITATNFGCQYHCCATKNCSSRWYHGY